MKFLCVSCDEQMKLKETQGPDEGSFTIVFRCPKCEREFALLTNPMETQVVRALDIKIGGSPNRAAEPMEATRTFLTPLSQKGESEIPNSELQTPKSTESASLAGGQAGKEGSASGPGCPFTEIVNEAFQKSEQMVWVKEAEERMEKIPEAVRPMAKMGIEHYAREKGYKEITLQVLEEAKGKFGM